MKKLKQLLRTWLSYPLVYLGKATLRLIVATCRLEVRDLDPYLKCAEKGPTILILWHNRLVLLPGLLYQHAPQFTYCAVISRSRDGELLSILANSYRAGRTLRVAHNARHQALNRIVQQLKNNQEIMVITPDGPRGPIYKVKPGVVIAARETGAHIVSVSWTADRFWELKSWDRMRIPKPFSHIVATFGAPLKLGNDRSLEEEMRFLEEYLGF